MSRAGNNNKIQRLHLIRPVRGWRETGAVCGIIFFLWISFFDFAGLSAQEQPLRKSGGAYALVIGNNDYEHLTPLQSAVTDAVAIAGLLEVEYDFRVTTLINANKKEIIKSLNRFKRDLTENDSFLVYYAGHGTLEMSGEIGYWQPIDAEEDDDFNWIANAELTRRFRTMPARHVLVIADSCYSGSLLRAGTPAAPEGPARREWLQRQIDKRSRSALTSGGLEPVVDQEGSERHSVFAAALLKHLTQNQEVLSASELFNLVAAPVVAAAEQTPAFGVLPRAGHEGGGFLFWPRTARALPAAAEPPASTQDMTADTRGLQEIEFWKFIKDSKEAADFKAYLETFPDGTFAPLAKIQLQRLNRSPIAHSVRSTVQPRWRDTVAPVGLPYLAAEDLELYTAPGKAASVMARQSQGSPLLVTGRVRSGRWLRVQLPDGGQAFVEAARVAPVPVPEARPPLEPGKKPDHP